MTQEEDPKVAAADEDVVDNGAENEEAEGGEDLGADGSAPGAAAAKKKKKKSEFLCCAADICCSLSLFCLQIYCNHEHLRLSIISDSKFYCNRIILILLIPPYHIYRKEEKEDSLRPHEGHANPKSRRPHAHRRKLHRLLRNTRSNRASIYTRRQSLSRR